MDGDLGSCPQCGDPLTEDHKHCAACGKLLVRRVDEPAYRWRQRRTCNKVCGTSYGGQKGQLSRSPGDWEFMGDAMDVDGDKLRAIVDEAEGLQGQIDVLNKSRTELYRAAKLGGFDPGTVKLVLRRRRLGESAVEYADAMLEAYEDALARARVQAHGTSCDESEDIVKRPFKISEFIETPSRERLMAGR